MVDLRDVGACSVMFIQITGGTDSEQHRAPLPSAWSLDLQILEAFLNRTATEVKRKSRRAEMDPSMIGRIIAIDPIGNGLLAVYWQTPDQMETNPQVIERRVGDDGPLEIIDQPYRGRRGPGE